MPGKAPESRQGLLPFPPAEPHYDEAAFVADASNMEAMTWLEDGWPLPGLVLCGPEGCGKTYLLRIWARRNGAPVWSGGTLPALDAVPLSGALAVDEADRITDEIALFHLLNLARERSLRLLMAARLPPSRWTVALPDLSSRLRTLTVTEIGPPSDDLLRALLRRFAADRQTDIPESTQIWLVRRMAREAEAVRRIVDQLDDASFREKRPITRKFAGDVLGNDFASGG